MGLLTLPNIPGIVNTTYRPQGREKICEKQYDFEFGFLRWYIQKHVVGSAFENLYTSVEFFFFFL